MNVGWTDDDKGGDPAPEGDLDAVPEAGPGDDFDPDVSLAGLRSSQAAERLRRQNREAERRREWATMSSLLKGSLGRAVVVHSVDRSAHSGTVVEVGGDYVAIESAGGMRWIALAAVCAVESPGEKLVNAESGEDLSSMLIDVIDDLIAAEAILSVTLVSGAILHGEPMTVGASLILVNPSRGNTAVNLDAIVAVQVTRP